MVHVSRFISRTRFERLGGSLRCSGDDPRWESRSAYGQSPTIPKALGLEAATQKRPFSRYHRQ